MGRRRKGRPISGWAVVDKPAGISSSAVVNKVRWAFNANKAGHAGTLDPDATGVLAVALGEATKTIPYVTNALKAYTFTVRLGVLTDTDDASGKVLLTSSLRPDDEEIKEALNQFVGDILQVPPQFSAVKVDGERAYKRARDGETIELEARPLYVDSLLMIDRPDADHVALEMVCGKGGYVRSIARDLGERLGCHAHVHALRRNWSGPFKTSESLSWEMLEWLSRTAELDAYLRPLEEGLDLLPQVSVSSDGARRLRNGNPAQVIANSLDYGTECWAVCEGEAVAVGRLKAGVLHPSRVFAAQDVNVSS
ncbi:MAG: tRNA pseudouridine(55) synthase TruB [Pseudomonadota bacterium]